jgi:hypothetical protein
MNLSQRKLNKAEWNSVEIPVSDSEKKILKLIKDSYHNINISVNDTLSIMNFLKISNTISNQVHIYEIYFQSTIQSLIKKYELTYETKLSKKEKINKANAVRIESNSNNIIKQKKDLIFEYILLDIITKILKYKTNDNHRWCYYYYTIVYLLKYNIENLNSIVIDFIYFISKLYESNIDKTTIIARSNDYIEKNDYILKYAPIQLYSHQKEVYNIFKTKSRDESKLVLYTAPTSTGKTLTPIGLAEKYKIIFVCAARHVGVSLAKSAISIGTKIAFAFGCETVDDIRLHYFAAKEFEKNWKSGGIFKVDNSVGDDVEIMICDIKSYLLAMYYMTSFNKKEDIIMYWDEPTITMDYEDHECHEYIHKNWNENIIPNIILSSATLPHENEIEGTLTDYMCKFENASYISVISNECKKSIPILDAKGLVKLPHLLYESYSDLKESIDYCKSYNTILRYFDLYEIVRFIVIVNEKNYIDDSYKIDNYFDSIKDITMESIKMYYLDILSRIKEESWNNDLYKYFKETQQVKYEKNLNHNSSGAHYTTSDAHTLTDGPTIYIADDVNKIAKFGIQCSEIPSRVINEITSAIQFNNRINSEIIKLEKEMEDNGIANDMKCEKEKKLSKDIVDPTIKILKKKIDDLSKLYKEITLDTIYIPNKPLHIKKWYDGDMSKIPFTSNIDNPDVERVMSIPDVEDIWKLLLLMGIGLFSKDKCIPYTELVKEFADSQKLYVIIANGDYIYGTNYQFCHSYLGKDLENMTQEKIIQAMGRVGRNKLQQDYSVRFRNDSIIKKLFIKEENKIEVKNMNNLFSTDV